MSRALELEQEGRTICHMEVGQPSSTAPQAVKDKAKWALENDLLGYTNALGISALRNEITKMYEQKYNVHIPSERVVITTGSSAAFLLSFLACFDEGASVGVCSSGYPCYRNVLHAAGLSPVGIPVNRDFKVTAVELEEEILRRQKLGVPALKGFIRSSPSNPTGAMLSPDELKGVCEVCNRHHILFISDEIYHGISYGTQKEATAAQFTDDVIVVNSFSKYFSMTGWRLGWIVVPHSMIDVMNRLSQNIYINAPTLSQIAACEAFHCEDELQSHLKKYTNNREIVLETLKELGIDDNLAPCDGAFYAYVDLSAHGVSDSPQLCRRILEEAGVAITPGIDFEDPSSGLGYKRLRFSFSRSTEEVREGMKRFSVWWRREMQGK